MTTRPLLKAVDIIVHAYASCPVAAREPSGDYTADLGARLFCVIQFLTALIPSDSKATEPNPNPPMFEHLSLRQLYELAGDISREVARRNRVARLPCVPCGSEVCCPDRVHAAEELSALPVSDINELAGRVSGELVRRYPQNYGQAPLAGPSAHRCSATLPHPTSGTSSSFRLSNPQHFKDLYVREGKGAHGEAQTRPTSPLTPESMVTTVAETMDIAREEMFQQAGLSGPAISHLFALLLSIISDKALHPHIRSMEKRERIVLMDSIQLVLDSGTTMDSTHRTSLTDALICMSRIGSLYPKALTLYGIQMAEETPSAEGSYGEIFKGRFGSHFVRYRPLTIG